MFYCVRDRHMEREGMKGERENTEVTVHEMKERPREKLNMLRA